MLAASAEFLDLISLSVLSTNAGSSVPILVVQLCAGRRTSRETLGGCVGLAKVKPHIAPERRACANDAPTYLAQVTKVINRSPRPKSRSNTTGRPSDVKRMARPQSSWR